MDNERVLYTVEKGATNSDYILYEKYIDRKKPTEIKTFYHETHAPNRAKLKEILEAAKGRDRSVSQFAKDCSDRNKCPNNTKKINTPTLSSILTENEVVRPLKHEVIQAILNNSADRSYTVKPDDLMRANGLEERVRDFDIGFCFRRGSIEEEYRREEQFLILKSRADVDIERCLKTRFKDVSMDLFYSSVANYYDVSDGIFRLTDRFGYYFPYNVNSVFKINDDKEQICWGFFIDDTDPDEFAAGKANVVRDHYDLFLDDIIDPWFEEKRLRFSFVFQNTSKYESAVRELKKLKVNCYMSVVLILEGNVVGEYVLARKDGAKAGGDLPVDNDGLPALRVHALYRLNGRREREAKELPLFGY